MKRITIEIDDETHARLIEKAKADERALVVYIRRVLTKDASKPCRNINK